MTEVEAEEIVRSYLCEKIELVHTEQLEDLAFYNFNASEHVLFTFRLCDHHSIGSSEYISLSKETGEVQYLGHCGE